MTRSPSPQYKVHQIDYGSLEYKSALLLRHRVFFAPHGIPLDQIWSEAEKPDQHFVILANGPKTLLAYGRLAQTNTQIFHLYQMVVDPHVQGQGLGTCLLLNMIDHLIQQNGLQLILNARIEKQGFYQKFGFESVGTAFASQATGLPHIQMQRNFD